MNKRKPLSDEHKRKIGNALKGKKRKPLTEEAKEKIRQFNLGKKCSKETRLKMSITHKNRLNGDNYYKNMPDCAICNKHLTSYKAKYCSNHKGITRQGKNCHLWKGGKTKINAYIRTSTPYKNWRKSVFERDNYTCQGCGIVGGYLQADHIKPFAYFPELRFDINNGRTLCVPCHKKTDTYGNNCYKKYENHS